MKMEILRRIFITASKVFPGKYKKSVGESLRYGGIPLEPEIWLGESLILGFLVSIVIAFLSIFGNPLLFYILAGVAFIIYLIGSYSIPYFSAMNRADSVESCLPSALQLMASNVRAGMTPFQAMKFSARDEFGLLKEEFDRATTKALGTASFPDALLKMTERIKLPSLERAVKLFSRCIESGGPLANVMEETARDISEMRALKKELLTQTQMYTLLILFVIVIGAPFLLTSSIHFTEKLTELRSSFDVSEIEEMGMGGLIGGEAFTPEFLVNISTVYIVITSLIAGLLIGVIREGQEKYGLKYAALLVPLTLIIFYLIRYGSQLIMM